MTEGTVKVSHAAAHSISSSFDGAAHKGVLVTAFDAFGGSTVNPSWLAVRQLHALRIAGHFITTARLPTAFKSAALELESLLQLHQPSLVICTGVASGRHALSIERVAINIDDARIADNTGAQPIDEPVVKGAPAAYFSTLPIKAILTVLRQAGLPAEISQTAGTFVCNHIFFHLMHRLAAADTSAMQPARGGFIHVPDINSVTAHGMPLHDIVTGLKLALHCALNTQHDMAITGGSIA